MEENAILDIEEDFFEACEKNGISAFMTISYLTEGDIFLFSLNDFFDVCKLNNIHSVFFRYDFPDKENLYIDIEYAAENLKKNYANRIKFTSYRYPDIPESFYSDIAADIVNEMTEHAQRQNKRVEEIDEEVPVLFEAFACLNGCKIGFFISDEDSDEDEIEMDAEEESLLPFKTFYKKYYDEMNSALEERFSKAEEKEKIIQEEKRVLYEKALEDIENFLKTDEKIMTCKYKNSRQTYADQLRYEWGEKIGQTIMQKDVKAIVEKVYAQRNSI